ncbi:hypothetical protein MNV49_001125 [Pseudohyphozyma bogoriensis]|nr:hypothetical protein MNV49_001125 [Pseudohyphozyma bogoriensis]
MSNLSNSGDSNHLATAETKVDPRYQDIEALGGLQGGAALGRQISVQLTAEQFERLYLQPGGQASKGDLAKRFANPTGPFYFIGGLGLFISGLLEFFIGNTFPSVVFMTFGGFWFAFAWILDPTKNIASALGGSTTADYNFGLGIYLIWWGVLVLSRLFFTSSGLLYRSRRSFETVYLIASLRTNVVFVLLFFWLDITFWLLVAAYLRLGHGNEAHITTILKTAGAFAFLTCCMGWYLLVVLLFGSTGIPISLPVGDLSGFLNGKRKDRED